MFDARLRQTKQRLLAPLADLVASFPPIGLTGAGLVLGIASALAAADSRWWLALILFAANRLVDGLDGEVARARGEANDCGGYADIVVDTIVYASIPLGAAVGSGIDHIWPLAAILMASFYVNTITWAYLAALIEKRRGGDAPSASPTTSIVMPAGLVEGAETIAFFVFMLAFPGWLDWTIGIMAGAVSLGAASRFARGHRSLRASTTDAERVSA